MRIFITVSVALNFLLLTSIVVARVDVARNGAPNVFPDVANAPSASGTGVAGAEPRDSIDPGAAGSVRAYYELLRSRGLDRAAAKPYLALWVQRDIAFRGGAETGYWRAADSATNAAVRERLAHEARMRATLRSIYGDGIEQDPDFYQLFFPLGTRFDFLTSAEQVAVREWQRRTRSEDAANAPAREFQSHGLCTARATVGADGWKQRPDEREPLSALLGEHKALEFAMRVSPLASRLRSLGLDETQFRKAFEGLSALHDAADPERYLERRIELRRLLGDRRFDRLMSAEDPLYVEARRFLLEHDAAEHQIAAAYSIMSRAQEDLMMLLIRRPDRSGIRDEALTLANRERSQLGGLLGERMAAGLLQRRQAALRGAPDC